MAQQRRVSTTEQLPPRRAKRRRRHITVGEEQQLQRPEPERDKRLRRRRGGRRRTGVREREVQSGLSGPPSVRAACIGSRLVLEDRHPGRSAAEDRRAARAVAARGG